MQIVHPRYRGLFAALFATFVVFGVSCTVVGAALPTILAQFGWSYAIAGTLMAMGSLGSVLGIYVAGRAIDRFGPKGVIVTGFALCSASLFLFGTSPSPAVNIALYFALGIGQACLEGGVNWMAFRMDEEGAGRPMSLMHGAFSIGAVVGPFLMGIILSARLPWTLLYRASAALNLCLLAVAIFLPMNRITRTGTAEQGARAARPNAARYLGFVALLFYVGTELGISNWAAEYFVRDFAWTAAQASFIVSVFWAGLAAGRFGIPLLRKDAKPGRLLVLLSVLLAAAVTLLAAAGLGGSALALPAALATALAGFGASCIYPSVITLVGGASEADAGRAIGIAGMGGSAGSFAFPFLMSAIATTWGVGAGFAFYAAMALVSLACCAALARYVAAVHKTK